MGAEAGVWLGLDGAAGGAAVGAVAGCGVGIWQSEVVGDTFFG